MKKPVSETKSHWNVTGHFFRNKYFRSDQKNAQSGRYPSSIHLYKRHPKNNEELTLLDRSSAIGTHVLETERHVDFDNAEILSKYGPIYRDRINSSLATSRRHATEKAKPLIQRGI